MADLRPKLRPTVQISRQHFRGRMWHVVEDPASNQFFRVNPPAYYFVAMLDGRRSVADVWRACNEELGDNAPTQGEVIQLLGQLYVSNLLQADLPPDAQGLFERYRKRVGREVRGYLMNFLFIRIPLIDPDHFLDRWVGVLGKVFTLPGLILWLGLLAAGIYHVLGKGEALISGAEGILSLQNIPLLYVALVITKVFHEFGHAFACKEFGRRAGRHGEVHTMGVMFLVFTPLPYVDASSAWAFRKKWHRVVVGSAGMMVEFAVAAVAAIIWARTSPSHWVHAVTYNMMFIASVSSLLFNGNPLLRFDGYYILSDLLEIPNLHQRSRGYIYYLVRRYLWRVRRPRNPAHTAGERFWLPTFAVASTAYRVLICVGIVLFVANRLLALGVVLALLAVFVWVLVPLGKFVRYLVTNPELQRVRGRAIGSVVATLVLLVAGLGLMPAPDRYRVEGVVEPVRFATVRARAPGFVRTVHEPSGREVEPGTPLVWAENHELRAKCEKLRAELRRLRHRRKQASVEDVAIMQALSDHIAAVEEQAERAEEELASLTLRAPLRGLWIAPDLDERQGDYLKRGEEVGVVASVDDLLVRATAGQDVAGTLFDELELSGTHRPRVELRVSGRPDSTREGRIVSVLPGGQTVLPSAALGYGAGGSVQTEADDPRGRAAAERFFELHVAPDRSAGLRSGQRLVVRIDLPAKPLAVQWWRSILRLFQRRFRI
ncbi:MAG: hypothetical protein R6V58_16610 [Planctomycetota bacterium]